jgi:hypothetical protein
MTLRCLSVGLLLDLFESSLNIWVGRNERSLPLGKAGVNIMLL